MTEIRTFIAIPLSQEIQSKLEIIGNQFKNQGIRSVRWVSTNNIHLTLHFLGDISPNVVPALTTSLKQVISAQEKFSIEVDNLGTFPNLRQPRVIWTGLQRSTQLNVLFSLIGRILEQTGIPVEKRPFSPHLTLGRVKHSATPIEIQNLSEFIATLNIGSIGTLRVNSVILYKSDLYPQGPIYTPLAQFPLHN